MNPRECAFCKSNIKEVDWKETELLKRYLSASAKIVPKKRRGLCAKHQRKVALAIRRARTSAGTDNPGMKCPVSPLTARPGRAMIRVSSMKLDRDGRRASFSACRSGRDVALDAFGGPGR